MKNKSLFFVLALFVVTMATMSAVSAWQVQGTPDVTQLYAKIDGEVVSFGECVEDIAGPADPTYLCTIDQLAYPSLVRGENLNIKVVFTAGNYMDDVEVRAWLRGNGQTFEDSTSEYFDVYAGHEYVKYLTINLPESLKTECNSAEGCRDYTLHLEITKEYGKVTGVSEAEIETQVQRAGHDLSIKSLFVEPECTNFGGSCSYLYTTAVIKNTGNHVATDVYARATIKELGISATRYVGDLVPYNEEDEDTTKEVVVRLTLPKNIQPGTYTIVFDTYSDESETTATQTFVVDGTYSTRMVDVAPQVTQQNVEAGKGVVYSMLVSNQGSEDATFNVEVYGIEGWATTQVTPASFNIGAGETRVVNVYLAVDENAIEGEHIFSVKVRSGTESKSLNLVAMVGKENSQLDLKSILMIVGIVLAVAIVVMLIVLLSQKGRSDLEKPEESYY